MTGRPRTIDHDAIAAMRLAGVPFVLIAERLGCNPDSARRIATRLGITNKCLRGTAPKLDHAAILAAVDSGMSSRAVGRQFGCAGGTVRKLMLDRRRARQAALASVSRSPSSITLASVPGGGNEHARALLSRQRGPSGGRFALVRRLFFRPKCINGRSQSQGKQCTSDVSRDDAG